MQSSQGLDILRKANRKALGAGHPVGSHPARPREEPAHFRSRTLGFTPDSGQAEQQEGSGEKRCSLSWPRRLAVPGTQLRRERGVEV